MIKENNIISDFKYENMYRDRLQDCFDRAFNEKDYKELRNLYRKLRQIEFKIPDTLNFECINISKLVENITCACDVIMTDTNVNFIYCGNDVSNIKGDKRLITKAILCLLSNAYLYGTGNLITVKTVEQYNVIRISVSNEQILRGSMNYGRGLDFVMNVCKMHNGKLLTECTGDKITANIVLECSNTKENDDEKVDCFSLVADRLSPLYIELFGMEYH